MADRDPADLEGATSYPEGEANRPEGPEAALPFLPAGSGEEQLQDDDRPHGGDHLEREGQPALAGQIDRLEIGQLIYAQ